MPLSEELRKILEEVGGTDAPLLEDKETRKLSKRDREELEDLGKFMRGDPSDWLIQRMVDEHMQGREEMFQAVSPAELGLPPREEWKAMGPIGAGEVLGGVADVFMARDTDAVNPVTTRLPYIGGLFELSKLKKVQEAADALKANAKAGTRELDLSFAPGPRYITHKKLTNAERTKHTRTLGKFIMEMDYVQTRGTSIPGQITQGALDMIPYAIEMFTSGGMSAGVKKATVDKLGKSLLAKAAGWTAAGAARTSTVMAHRVAEDYARRRLPEMAMTRQGEVVLGAKGATPFTAAWKAFGSVLIEAMSEEAGETIGKVAGWGGRKILSKLPQAAQASARTMASGLRKAWMKTTGKSGTAFTKLLKRAGYDGILEEMSEERLGDVMRAVTGIEDFGTGDNSTVFQRIAASLPSGEQLAVEAGIFAVPMAGRVVASRLVKDSPELAAELAEKESISRSDVKRAGLDPKEFKSAKDRAELQEEIKKEATSYREKASAAAHDPSLSPEQREQARQALAQMADMDARPYADDATPPREKARQVRANMGVVDRSAETQEMPVSRTAPTERLETPQAAESAAEQTGEEIAEVVPEAAESDAIEAEGLPDTSYSLGQTTGRTINLADVQETFPGTNIRNLPTEENGWRVTFEGGNYLDIAVVDNIDVDWEAAEKQEGRKIPKSERETILASGAFEMRTKDGQVMSGLGLVQISKDIRNPDGTLRHEALHFAHQAGLFSTAEWDALVRKHSSDNKSVAEQEEDIAQARGAWRVGTKKSVTRKIVGWIKGLLKKVGISAGDVNRLMDTAEFWKRAPNPLKAGKSVDLVYGRPDLANIGETAPVRRLVDEVDESRKADKRRRELVVVQQNGMERANKDLDGEKRNLIQTSNNGGVMNDEDVVTAKAIVNRTAAEALKSGDAAGIEEARQLISAYREAASEWGRAGLQMRDPLETPSERRARSIIETVLSPSYELQRKIVAAKKTVRESSGMDRKAAKATLKSLQKQAASEVGVLTEAMKDLGIDLSKLDEIASDEYETARVLREASAQRSSFFDKVVEFWKQSILSAMITHIRNIAGNTAHMMWRLVGKRFVEANINLFTGNKAKGGATFKEFGYVFSGFFGSFSDAYRNARKAWRTEIPSAVKGITGKADSAVKFDQARVAIGGKFGRFVRAFGYRGLTAMDEFAKTLIAQAEVGAQAYRIVNNEGLTGPAIEARIAELMKTPVQIANEQARMETVGNQRGPLSKEAKAFIEKRAAEILPSIEAPAWAASLEEARITTFQEKPGKLAKLGIKARETAKPLHFLLPFITTPVNIFRTGMKMSPLGSLKVAKDVYDAAKTGDWSKVPASVAENLLGWAMIMAIGFQDPDDPWITGTKAQTDRKQRDLSRSGGTPPPQSIKLFGEWYSYANIEPFATAIATTVDISEAMLRGESVPNAAFKSTVNQSKNKTFLQGIGDFARAAEAEEPGEKVYEWVTNIASSFIPNFYRASRRAAREEFPERRIWGKGKQRDERIVRRTFQKMELTSDDQPAIDTWGRVARPHQGWSPATDWLWHILVPSRVKGGKLFVGDAVYLKWNQLHPEDERYPQRPKRMYRAGGETHYMTDEQLTQFATDAGQTAARLIESEKPNATNPSEGDIDAVQDAITLSRKKVKAALIKEWTGGPPAQINPAELAGELRAGRIVNHASIMSRKKPMSLRQAQKTAGMTIEQAQKNWQENRQAALLWLKERGVKRQEIEDEHLQHRLDNIGTTAGRKESRQKLTKALNRLW